MTIASPADAGVPPPGLRRYRGRRSRAVVLPERDMNVDLSTYAPPSGGAAPLRIALAGCGRMAVHHARAIGRLADRATLVAYADPSSDARAAMQQVAPGAHGHAELDALLDRERPDIVHVCTPPALHERSAMSAIAAGCHIYVEKPFADSLAATRRVLDAAAARGVRVTAGHQLLFEAPARRAFALLPAAGPLSHVESYFSFRTVRRSPDGRAPLRADLQLLDILPHPTYLLLATLERASPEGETRLVSLEIGGDGSVHALLRRGGIVGTLVVTLEGRPVESYLRLVGANGVVHADFVRGTVQRLLGPGVSGIDKVLNPYILAGQLGAGTTAALARRALRRQRSYPGLAESFASFYDAIRGRSVHEAGPAHVLDTMRLWEAAREAIAGASAPAEPRRAAPARGLVLVTGGTGLLGREVTRALLGRGHAVRVSARREPPPWEREPGVEYVAADLAEPCETLLRDVDAVVHCAAATAGGWTEHQRNSLDATTRILEAAAAAGVRRVLHVSSLAVLAAPRAGAPLGDDDALEARARERGPYVWGKTESERIAERRAEELGLDLRIVRPGALVDSRRFDPPGRLGKRIGPLFVAVGMPGDALGVVEVSDAAAALAWMIDHWEEAPARLNLLDAELPTKRELLARLRAVNPDLRVLWLPMPVLRLLSWGAIAAQRLLRPGRPAIDVARVFAEQRYDTTRSARIAAAILRERAGAPSALAEREEDGHRVPALARMEPV